MPTRKLKKQGHITDVKQATLTYFTDVKQIPLTDREKRILGMLTDSQHPTYQADIAKKENISRSAVSQIVKKLVSAGLLVPPRTYRDLTKTAMGGTPKFYDLDWREIGYSLSKDVKLPHDDDTPTSKGEWEASGVYNSVWHPKGKNCTIRLYLGKTKRTLTIAIHGIEGNSIPEVDYNHDQKTEDVLYWLFYHFPDLKDATAPWQKFVVKTGEHHFRPADQLAKEIYEEYGNIKTEVYKIDKTPPPVALEFLNGIASKSDIERLESKLDTTTHSLLKVADSLNALYEFLKKLVGGGENKQDIPPKPMAKDDEGMFG